jgi:hypothetical protein
MRFLAAITLCTLSMAGEAPPSPYVAKGACPFEGCVYREWMARRALDLYDRPGGRIGGHLRRGERVRAITGEVHCRPVRVVAERDFDTPTAPPIRKGEVYYLLHYLGEGAWRVWVRGALTEVEGLPPDARKPATVWWAQVRTRAGVTGWVLASGNFDGQDMLAAIDSPNRS